MSFNSKRFLDGYVLTPTSNSFVGKWIDAHSSPFVNIAVSFSSSSVDGYGTIEQSNDREARWIDGSLYPASAQFTGTYGTGPTGDPVDLATVAGTSVVITSANSPFVNGNPGIVFSTNIGSARWFRFKFVAITNVATTVTGTFSWKSTS